MSKYTAEQARDWHRRESSWRNQLGMYESERKHSEMADAIDALLRERESAKAAVTNEMVEIAVNAHDDWFGGHRGMRAALEAVAPMLASARVPDGWQLVRVSDLQKIAAPVGTDMDSSTTNSYRAAIYQQELYERQRLAKSMLAAAPKPEKE